MILQTTLENSIKIKSQLLENTALHKQFKDLVSLCVNCFQAGGSVYFCGNGGSAADAQHLAAELSGRYYFDRPPLPSEALHVNSSYLTAVANDYGYQEVYARAVKAFCKAGDVLIGLSTSGNSANVIKALEQARMLKVHTIAFTGENGGRMGTLTDMLFAIPSTDTPRIQEAHMLIGHSLCQAIEAKMFGELKP